MKTNKSSLGGLQRSGKVGCKDGFGGELGWPKKRRLLPSVERKKKKRGKRNREETEKKRRDEEFAKIISENHILD